MNQYAGVGVSADEQNRIEENCRERREGIVHGFELSHLFVLLFLFSVGMYLL